MKAHYSVEISVAGRRGTLRLAIAIVVAMGKRLIWIWSGLDFLLLTAGVLALIFSVVVRTQDGPGTLDSLTLRRLVISNSQLNCGMILGIAIITSWLVSVVGIATALQRGRFNATGLVTFNWSLVAVLIVTVAVGSNIWFFTLRERLYYLAVWNAQSQTTQEFLQDTLHCCGYFNATLSGSFNAPTGFCASVAANTDTTAVQACVTPITIFADTFLNQVFSMTYGFVAIEIALFLASVCLIKVRLEEERFRRIDEKQGRKGGFV